MKIISYIIVIIFLISSLSSIGTSTTRLSEINKVTAVNTEKINLQFLKPETSENEKHIEVNIEGANGRIFCEGAPILPIYTKTIIYPFDIKITNIEFETSIINNIILKEKILPGPKPVTKYVNRNIVEYKKDVSIYNSNNLYPKSWFNYYINAGRDENNEQKIFLTLRVYPIRYSPTEDKIEYIKSIDITINFEEPIRNQFSENSEYDLVIIAPSKFSDELERLVIHKNNFGVETLIKTTEEIYDEFSGVDKPEQIKYFIKDALDNWKIKYVLLVGGMNSLFFGDGKDDRNHGSKNWHVPVRYTNHYEGSGGDPGFISDLYYADIYDGEGNFSSWDSDGDGIFAFWRTFHGKDVIDLFPDVYVGRLACRNTYEVKIMIDKIIKYESTGADPEWFNKIVAVAGDTHNDPNTNYPEGELMCEYVIDNYLSDLTPVKLYASNKDIDAEHTCTLDNIKREISAGCGHIFFTGHGNTQSWNTHWPGIFNWKDTPGGIGCYDFLRLNNKEKLPICLVEACHNSQFNVTFFMYGMGYPECWSWWLTRKIGGGAIATLGHTGLSYELIGEHGDLDGDGENLPDCLEARCGFQNIQFYKTIYEGIDILGEVWGGTISKYLTVFPGMENQQDAKTISQWVLLGDPSLKIGGYP